MAPSSKRPRFMLSGAILNAAVMHGHPPEDEVIAAAVDIVLDAAR